MGVFLEMKIKGQYGQVRGASPRVLNYLSAQRLIKSFNLKGRMLTFCSCQGKFWQIEIKGNKRNDEEGKNQKEEKTGLSWKYFSVKRIFFLFFSIKTHLFAILLFLQFAGIFFLKRKRKYIVTVTVTMEISLY